MRRSIHILGALGLVASSFQSTAYADDKDVIAYRQDVMNILNAQVSALGMILSSAVPDDNAVAHLDALALTAATAVKAFEPKVLGGEAKPEVWSKWPDFSKRMKDLADKTAASARTAHASGKEAALATILDALPCKACHETYRQEAK